jgi:HTH-type transcriptional regulator / antitoxin HigA
MASKKQISLTGKTRDAYLERILAFPLASIHSDEQLAAALAVIDRMLVQGKLNAGETLYLDALSDLVASYEDRHHAIAPSSDSDMLRHFMDAKGVTQADLSRETGIPKSSVSEVLAGKKPLSRQMIRKLAVYFQVEPSVLAANL